MKILFNLWLKQFICLYDKLQMIIFFQLKLMDHIFVKHSTGLTISTLRNNLKILKSEEKGKKGFKLGFEFKGKYSCIRGKEMSLF